MRFKHRAVDAGLCSYHYHQIWMKVEEQEKTSFITPFGAFYYITMPFGLKNAGAMYQRCIQNYLHEQIGRNVNAYVDDIIVKSHEGSDLLNDLHETFTNLRQYKMKLNPTKCVFVVLAGKLLGFIVSHRGIEANPKKIDAILHMKKSQCVVALSRFVS